MASCCAPLLVVALLVGADPAGLRTWTDNTGKFTIEAELISRAGDQVTLRTKDDRKITLTVSKLSTADQQHLAKLAAPSSSSPARPPEPAPAGPAKSPRISRLAVAAALEKRTRIDLDAVPLAEALPLMQELAGVPIVLDTRGLKEQGINPSQPVTLKDTTLPLEAGLAKLLDSLKLAAVPRDEVIYVTSRERESDYALQQVRVYLLTPRVTNVNGLVEEITAAIQPQSWDETGGPGSIEFAVPRLVVRNSYAVHRAMEKQFAAFLKAPAAAERRAAAPALREWSVALAALGQPATCEFAETPLRAALDKLAADHKLEITVNQRALDDAGIAADSPVTLSLRGVRLGLALQLLLESLHLSYVPAAKGLEITTQQDERNRLVKVNYIVRDLVTQQGGNVDVWQDLLTVIVDPASWDEVGGPGSIKFDQATGAFEISQPFHTHQRLLELLADIRAVGTR